jgi:enamine deaminase RidA (YjgF/YER057c/UK114 family)
VPGTAPIDEAGAGVPGTAPIDEAGAGVPGVGDAHAQARLCLELVERALRQLGADRTGVVRTRLIVTDILRWADYGRAHAEFFAGHPLATTMSRGARR